MPLSDVTASFIKKMLRYLAAHNPDMLRNAETVKLLHREGVAVIPFLFPEELAQVKSFYDEIKNQYTLPFTHGMHMTLWHSDLQFKQKVKAGLLQILQPAYERNFSGCRWMNNIFMVKQAHTPSEFAMHSDWSIVDESKYSSLNVWIPLQDTTIENGAIWVIKGSHKIDLPIRGGGALLPDFSGVGESLRKYCVPITAKAGEAILFYHKTVHGSYPNASDFDRVVSTFSVIPQRADLRICFQKDADSPLEIHEPADDFNYKYNDLLNDTNTFAPSKRPKETQVGYKQKKITAEDILPFIIQR